MTSSSENKKIKPESKRLKKFSRSETKGFSKEEGMSFSKKRKDKRDFIEKNRKIKSIDVKHK